MKASRLSSWKCPFSASSARRCSSCMPVSSASGASSAANGAKFSETLLDSRAPRAQPIAAQISHSLKPFGVVRRRGIDESDSALPRRRDARSGGSRPALPSGAKPTTKTASLVAERRRARRAPSRSRARAGRRARSSRDRLELAREARRRARSGAGRRAVKPALLEPVHRLAHLADRAALERERRGVDDRLVAVVERVQAVRARTAASQRSDAPRIATRQSRACAYATNGATSSSPSSPRADRVARDDRDAADDAVGEERGLVARAKKYDLSARSTNGASVSTPQACTSARASSRSRSCCTTRWRHGASQPATTQAVAASAEQQQRQREPVAERPARCGEPRRSRPSRPRRDLARGEPARERLVGGHAVQPERGRRRRRRSRAAGDAEPAERAGASSPRRPARRSRGGGRRGRRASDGRGERAVVEAVQHVQDVESAGERDRDLPGTPAAAREAARGDEQRDARRARRPRARAGRPRPASASGGGRVSSPGSMACTTLSAPPRGDERSRRRAAPGALRARGLAIAAIAIAVVVAAR